MTILGVFFQSKSINKANISRLTGISPSRLTRLSRIYSSKLTAEELYLISIALEIKPSEILDELYGNLKLNNQ